MHKKTSEKTATIIKKLDTIKNLDKENETLMQMVDIIRNKTDFYEICLQSWKTQGVEEKWTVEEISTGKKCCKAGLGMAETIANEMRILFRDVK